MAVQIGSENGAPENPIEYNGVSWISPDNSHSVDFCRYNTKYPPFLNKPRNLPRLWHWQGKQWNTLKHHFKNIENRWKKENDIKMTRWERPLIYQCLAQAWTAHSSGQARTPRWPPRGNIDREWMGSTWKNRILVVGIKMNKDDKGW